MSAFSAIIASLATSAWAIPALNSQTGASCAGFGSGSTDSPGYNFTLTAHNTTLPNTNSTGVPLVLGWGPPGQTSPEVSIWAISTYAEWHCNEWPYFSFGSGALYPNPGPDEQGMGAYDYDIAPGAEVGFYMLPADSGPQNPEI